MTHPSLVEKPALTVADLHLIGKFFYQDGELTLAEHDRYDALADVFDDYLTVAVGDDWDAREALVP